MSNVENLYKILGVETNATDEEIKRAFRKLASENHPDRNPGDSSKEELFKKINSAYQTLGDKNKRFAYDGKQNNSFENPFHGRATHVNINDIFNQGIWGDQFRDVMKKAEERARQQQQPPAETYRRGDDITITMTLTLSESVYGCKKSIKVRSPRPSVVCTHCNGSCAEPGTRKISCNSCSGSGKRISLPPPADRRRPWRLPTMDSASIRTRARSRRKPRGSKAE